MRSTVTALFDNRPAAEKAVHLLERSGFGEDDISLMMSDGTHGSEWDVTSRTKAPEGAAVGAATGGLIGALAAGLTSVTVATGGVGFFVAGPILSALAGAGAGGSAGGVVGALIGAGVPEHEAELLESELASGRILVGVLAHPDQADSVAELLRAGGGTSVTAS